MFRNLEAIVVDEMARIGWAQNVVSQPSSAMHMRTPQPASSCLGYLKGYDR